MRKRVFWVFIWFLICWWIPVPLSAADGPSDDLPIDVFIPEYTEPEPVIVIAADRWMPEFEAGSDSVLNIPIKMRADEPTIRAYH